MDRAILVNRAPVLALWASVVAERLGYGRDAALSLGRALTGLNAQSKGRSLGILHQRQMPDAGRETPEKKPERTVELMGREIPVENTKDGLRAVSSGRPVSAESAAKYLESKFGPDLSRVRAAMEKLAGSRSRAELAETAYGLYEKFRPQIPAGVKGWGVKGKLDIGLVAELSRRQG